MQDFEHGVVRVLGEVRDRLTQQLAAHIDAVHVAFGPARCDVAPGLICWQPRQLSDLVYDFAFGLMCVRLVARVAERIADVVRGKPEQGIESGVVEVLIDRITRRERA